MPINLKQDNIEEKYGLGGGDWLKIKEGDNKVRIVSGIEDFGSHYLPNQNKSQICIGSENGCPICSMGLRPSVKFLCYAIDRKDGLVKLLQFGYTIFKQYKDFANDAEYGFSDIPEYDCNIKRTGQGKETEYTLIPARETKPLTAEEQLIVNKIDKPVSAIIEAMKNKVTPTEPLKDEPEINLEDIPF